MITKNGLVVFLTFLLASFPASLPAQETITWLEANFPPFLIHEGQYKGQGYGDVISKIIRDNLTTYKHKRVSANISRHYRMFKRQENVCTVGLYKTEERLEFLHFSLPSFFTLPNVIVINRSKFDAFGGKNEVSLASVLNNNLIIGQTRNRSYGRIIDSILKKFGNKQNTFVYEGKELSLNFFAMLKRDRLDGIIGLPEEVLYQAENLGIRDQIITLSIKENRQSLDAWLSHVVCSKTPWGKRVIEDINHVLVQTRPKEEYRAAYERWLDPGRIESYRMAYDNHFLKPADSLAQ